MDLLVGSPPVINGFSVRLWVISTVQRFRSLLSVIMRSIEPFALNWKRLRIRFRSPVKLGVIFLSLLLPCGTVGF